MCEGGGVVCIYVYVYMLSLIYYINHLEVHRLYEYFRTSCLAEYASFILHIIKCITIDIICYQLEKIQFKFLQLKKEFSTL